MNRLPTVAVALCLLAGSTLNSPSLAAEENWNFTVVFPMVWAPDISGEVDVDGISQDIDVSFSDIMDNLDTGFIGEFYAEHGAWGLAVKAMYLGTETTSKTEAIGQPGRPPIIGQHEIEMNSELYTGDLIASYNFTPEFGLYSGVRVSGSRIKMKYKPVESSPVSESGRATLVDDQLYDWIIGFGFDYPISNKWSLGLEIDSAISGDNDTDRQLNALVNYKISELHNVWFGYRYLELEYEAREDGSTIKNNFTQQGPTLGWAFTF